MEQEKSALTKWLERREKSETEPDDDFLNMLAELFRGQQEDNRAARYFGTSIRVPIMYVANHIERKRYYVNL